MLSIQGFERTEIRYLSPVEGSPFSQGEPASAYLHDRLFGPQDYGVIGYKPGGE